MSKITYDDGNAVYSVEVAGDLDMKGGIKMVLDRLLVPVLRASGYQNSTIMEYINLEV